MLIIAKYHIVLIRMRGMGRQVKKTVMRRKTLRPHISDRAPMRGALRNERMPLRPCMRPLAKNVLFGNVSFNTF